MKRLAVIICLCFAFSLGAGAQTNSLVWNSAGGKVSADIQSEQLWPLLEDIAHQTGWHIFVEPGADENVSTKFENLSTGDALKMLLGDLNFAFVPQTNGPNHLYVFRTTMQAATRPVIVAKSPRRVPNQLIIRVKPGTDIDALAKMLGAKIVGRLDKDGIYLLQFADAAATDAALALLKSNSNTAEVDYNYYLDPPPAAQGVSSAPLGPVSLSLNPPTDASGKVTVGLVDTAVQSLGNLDSFISKRISVADGSSADNGDITHGTSMAETILRAVASAQSGGSSVQIVSADVYGSGESATTWNVALGVQAVIDNGANVVNLSLGGAGQSSVLGSLIQTAESDGIVFFAAAGNEPVSTATYPAAYPGVNAVTAVQNGQIAPYADYGGFVDMALPGQNIVYLGNQPYLVTGTSVSTAYATGVFAGNVAATGVSWQQIVAAMQKKFVVPKK